MNCPKCNGIFASDYCPEHEKPLVRSINIGLNAYGFTTAVISCHTKQVYADMFSTPRYSEHEELHQPYAQVFIETHNDNYRCECIKIPFESKPDTSYTLVEHTDKNQVSVIIVPIDFIYPKE
ncbi:hypothetical protein LP092_13560 [Moraxella bovis]|uniref:DUF2199 domain-containing protein n=1 Tax=Moraxella bovis TaxID=476 RepID=A0ABY6M740_MORBO|nr:hypothetical protein [Moraxella bovis]UZA02943.1 hypothetical protein LP092_13560 [Moraxella bovis]